MTGINKLLLLKGVIMIPYKNRNLIFLLIIFLTAGVFAQDKVLIEGNVSDQDGIPLAFANVFIKNTPEGTMTNDNGTFKFFAQRKDKITLIASMVGYKNYSKEFNLKKAEHLKLNIKLNETAVIIKETVVSASSYSSVKGKGVVVNRADIYTTPGGAADIYQSLKTLPGLTQVSESAELFVRGGASDETITLVDQTQVYHPFSFESQYGGLFSNVNTSVVKNLFFSSGGFSAEYGNALSGVLSIETRDMPKEKHLDFGLSLANASLSAEMPIIKNKLGLYIDARQEFTKPIFWLNGGMSRLTNAPTSQNLSGGINYSYSGKGRLKLFTILADDQEGVKVEKAEFNGIFNGNSKNHFFNLQNSYIFSDNLLMKNSLSYNSYFDKWMLGVLDLITNDKIYSFRNELQFEINPGSLVQSGIDLEDRFTGYDGIIPLYDYDYRPDAPATKINASIHGKRIGAYSEIQFSKPLGIKDILFSSGVRYDWIPELQLGWIDPRLSSAYKLNNNSTLRFSWGIYHELPDLKLFRPEDGNPNLKPMEAVHYILSFDHSINESNYFRVEAYYKKYLNLPLSDTFVNYNNNGYGFAEGIDFIYKGIFPFGITGWISYGYINTKRFWMDFEKLNNSSFDITNNLSIIAKYNLNENFQLGLNIKYATGRPFTPIISAAYDNQLKIYKPVYASTNSGRFPDYKRIDLRITYFGQLNPSISLVAYLEGLNIFNFNNIFGYTYSPDYDQKMIIKSYFGQRMLVLGFMVGM